MSIESDLQEKLHNSVLSFIERDKANLHYSAVFVLEEIVAVHPNSVILKGMLSICGKSYEKGYIEYKSVISRTPTHFSRIRYYKSGSIRRINPLIPDPRYSQAFETLYQAIQSIVGASKS